MSAETEPAPRVCRGCGCTDEDGCLMHAGIMEIASEDELVGCFWVKPDLCSGCRWPGWRFRGPVVDHRAAPVQAGTGADDAAPAGEGEDA